MGIRVGNTGCYTGYPASSKAEACTAKRAPDPCKGGVGGTCCSARPAPTPPSGPGRCLQAPPWVGTGLPGQRARFDLISLKLSQNHEVSPKSVKKASRSPYFQNGLGKSALEIPRFPYSSAFSRKELMGLFDAQRDIIVKTTKCRPDVHPETHAKGSSRYPHRPAASCSWVGSSSGLSAVVGAQGPKISKTVLNSVEQS